MNPFAAIADNHAHLGTPDYFIDVTFADARKTSAVERRNRKW